MAEARVDWEVKPKQQGESRESVRQIGREFRIRVSRKRCRSVAGLQHCIKLALNRENIHAVSCLQPFSRTAEGHEPTGRRDV